MTYHIAINMDDRYIEHASTMLTSVFYNNPDLKFAIHVITAKLSKRVVKALQELIVDQYHQELYIYPLTEQQTSPFPEYVNSHISMAANYRLFVADILPETVHTVLYLDCDLVADANIKPLFELTLGDKAVAAVEDMWSGKEDNYQRLGYARQYGYFNSGVMLIALDYWRSHNLSKVFTDFLNTHPHLRFVDQDILNGVLHEHWLALPLRWNVQDGFLRRTCRIRTEYLDQVTEASKHPAIIHFTGSRKPWDEDCMNPYQDKYFKYLDMTPYKGHRPSISEHWKRKQRIDRLLIRLHLKRRRYRKDLGGLY